MKLTMKKEYLKRGIKELYNDSSILQGGWEGIQSGNSLKIL